MWCVGAYNDHVNSLQLIVNMKFGLILGVVAQLAASAFSYSIESGLVRVNEDILQYGEMEVQLIRLLTLENMKDKLEMEFKLDYKDVSQRPQQFVVTLGDDQAYDLLFVPNYLSSHDVYKLSVPVNKIPVGLRVKDKLFLRAAVGHSGPKKYGENLRRNLAEIKFGKDIREAALLTYKPAERFGLKPEIHHQFSSDAPTVNAVVPIVFIGGALVLFLGLLGVWSTLLQDDFLSNFSKLSGAQLVNHSVFLTSLVGFVVVFYRYYLGTSIFSTLFHAFILSAPSIFFGSRCLRDLAQFHKLELS